MAMSTLLLLAVATAALYVLRRVFPPSRSYPRARGVSLPAFLEFDRDPHKFLSYAYQSLGPLFWLDLILIRPVFALSLDANNLFYTSAEKDLSFNQATIDVTQHILTREQVFAARLNHLLLPGISGKSRLVSYGPGMIDWTWDFAEQWANESLSDPDGGLDLFQCISQLVTSICLGCFVGDAFAREHGIEVAALLRSFEVDISRPVLRILPSWFPHPLFRRIAATRARWNALIKSEIDARKADPEATRSRNDYLQYLVNEDKFQHEEEYAGIILGITFGALVNTTMTLSWALVHILKDSDLRKELLQEIDGSGLATSLEPHSTAEELAGGIAGIQRLPLLDSVLKEVMRYYSGLALVRYTMRPTMVDGHVIPKDTYVFVSPWLTNHSPALFDGPDTFRGDRFMGINYDRADTGKTASSKDGCKDGRLSDGFRPWGGGPHRCIGEKFALQALKTTLFLLLARYDPVAHGDARGVREAVPEWSKLVGTPECKGRVGWQLKRRSPS
ncbi:hypothetical protein BOTBODRAFT_57946 [Botryobasidium botryosum FD-172 SS1]|uniref:Cytochrome P450 n=1 Tax=Botryobasidium botryosum (strain FD-172 SS1) TaxID=930990 RepID=A0A067M430_BOTB1|nr:hypothetical protein BOTBODRAFT_57946 [Botryobasidium botryosum FD-172 SS1]